MQNLEWSEDSCYQGLQYEQGFVKDDGEKQESDTTRALEFYTNAIELDPLNK
jgi:hypothetical protein